jgi:hypothetical protein
MPVLKARIGGAWVNVGGGGSSASEVEVSATDPIGTNPSAELWYDTAAVASGVTVASPGLVAYAKAPGTTQNLTTNSTTDVTGLSVTFNAIAGHTYKTTVFINLQAGAAGAGVFHTYIANASNGVLAASLMGLINNETKSTTPIIVETGLSGTTTRKAQVALSFQAAGGTSMVVNDAARNAYIIVEDITPATADGLATAWTDVTFQNSWANKGGTEQTCQYRKIGDIVYLRGVMGRTAVTYDQSAFTLPVGYRPPFLLRILPLALNLSAVQSLSRVDLMQDGRYMPEAGPSPDVGWQSIDFQFSVTA